MTLGAQDKHQGIYYQGWPTDLLGGFGKVASPLWASPLKLYQIKMSIINVYLVALPTYD